jgi:hypothetical protein
MSFSSPSGISSNRGFVQTGRTGVEDEGEALSIAQTYVLIIAIQERKTQRF